MGLLKSHYLALLAAASSLFYSPSAIAEVLIAPTRVVLERGVRSADLIVVNKGGEDAAFRISIENRRMLSDGSMEVAEAALDGERFAKDLIRFSPRRVILEPGGQQTIRVSAALKGDLAPGEYRSHLRLMSAPLSAGRSLESAVGENSGELSIQLVAIRSLTIPVILRIGNLDAEVIIDDVDLQATDSSEETLLVARLSRSGSRSTYGNIEVFIDSQREPIYLARGIAVYTPNVERDVLLPIPAEVRDQIEGRDVRLRYVSADPLNPGIIAEYKTRLP